MVSKVAVMALVAVVAVPILLGYGLNIETVDEQVWAGNDDSINMSNYLLDTFDGTGATYTTADIYQMNSKVFYRNSVSSGGTLVRMKYYPDYTTTTTTSTVLSMAMETRQNTFSAYSSDGYSQGVVVGGYDASNYYTINLYTDGTLTASFDHVKTYTFDKGTVMLNYLNFANNAITRIYTGITQISMVVTGVPSVQVEYQSGSSYVDLNKGFRLNTDYPAWDPSDFPVDPNQQPIPNHGTFIDIAYSTRSVLMTMDLNTVEESDTMYQIQTASSLWLRKTTVDDVVKWEYATGPVDDPNFEFKELYYNPLASSNTYQLFLNANYKGEFRYIGAWPSTFGVAQAYLTYPYEIDPSGNPPTERYERINSLQFVGKSPVMRIDEVWVAAYNYMVMEDAVYDPASFRLNPATTLTNGQRFGQSIEFGGNTYAVSKGNITLGTHEVSLDGIVFDSVQSGARYENRINGNVVSITDAPSTITFNGKWIIDVSTVSQSISTVSETKWIPGHFAWNGLDDNFLIAGLMTSLAAFVGLAIYGRRSGAKVLPLLLVCGGAAFMFLLMM